MEVAIRTIAGRRAANGQVSQRSLRSHGVLAYFCSLSLATRTAHGRLIRICLADPERETVLVAVHTDARSDDQRFWGCTAQQIGHKNEAEGAVLVSDEYQGRGLGTELLRRVIPVRELDEAGG